MTATSHATIGALIAASIKRPEVALPLAFFSHFVADAIPHYGFAGHGGFGPALKHKSGKWVGITDPIFLISLMTLLLHLGASWYVFVAAILACTPDIEWFFAFLFYERKGKKPPRSPIANFHTVIQWCERPWGYITETIVIVGGFILLSRIIK